MEILSCEVNGLYHMYSGSLLSPAISLIFNVILILIIAGAVITLLNRSNFMGSGNEERLTRIEKDLIDTRKMVAEIKDKLDEI